MKSCFLILLILSALTLILANCKKNENEDDSYNWPKGLKGKILCEDDDDILIYDSNGINTLVLEQYYVIAHPRWSPDGAKIICNCDNWSMWEGPQKVCLLNSNGTNIHMICEEDCWRSPLWSPTGLEIIERLPGCDWYDPLNHWILSEIDTSCEIIREFGFLSEYGSIHDCAPDGEHLLSSSYEYTQEKSDIYELSFSSQQMVCLTNQGWNTDPEYSPDGTKIVYEYKENKDSNTEIWKMDVDGGNKVYLVTVIDTGDAHQYQHIDPTWSPDGSKIAFGKDGVLHIMNEDGTNVIKIGKGTKFYGEEDFDWIDQ